MNKTIFRLAAFLSFAILSSNSFANLYLKTEYQENKNPKVITKHHIFLEKKYVVNYTKKSYVLFLKKIVNNEATIETESYDFDQNGKKILQGGSLGTYKIGKSFQLIHRSAQGIPLFILKIVLERSVPSV